MNGPLLPKDLFRQDAQAVAFPTAWDNMPGRKRAEMGRNAQWKLVYPSDCRYNCSHYHHKPQLLGYSMYIYIHVYIYIYLYLFIYYLYIYISLSLALSLSLSLSLSL